MKNKLFTFAVLLALSSVSAFAQANFYDQLDYKGAFGSSDWTNGWTALYQYGVTAEMSTTPDEIQVTTDISGNEYWTADHTYILNGRIFVNDGGVLHIEAGTVIKGAHGSGENASALIVARGGKIYAEGTAYHPIIFTTVDEDLSNPASLSLYQNGLWGGVILLGKATINRTGGEWNIEGIPTTEPRGMYGGNDDNDNSGVFRYVSIRHGGAEIGEGNEINGLTLGGVGRGTTIDHVEVISNFDDGYEWFGGTVNCKYLVSAFCGDDCFDFDEGYRGKLQYLFAIQAPDRGNRCGEHDGAPASTVTNTPKAYPVIYNATYLGSGMNSTNPDQDELFLLREAFGGEYKNCIFGDYNGYGASVSDIYAPNDSKHRLAIGELILKNNIWFMLGKVNSKDSLGAESWSEEYLRDAANGNTYSSESVLAKIDRGQNGLLDPRPAADGPAYQNLTDYPTIVTGLSKTEFSNTTVPTQYDLQQNYPNPFNPTTTIEFNVPVAGKIKLNVYNLLGQKVATLYDDFSFAGSYKVTWNATNLASGMYIYRLVSASQTLTKRMLLIK